MLHRLRLRRERVWLDGEPRRDGRFLVLGPQLRQVMSILSVPGHLVALLVEQAAEPGFTLAVRVLQSGSDTQR